VQEATARIMEAPLDQLPSVLETFAWRYDKVPRGCGLFLMWWWGMGFQPMCMSNSSDA